MATQYAVVSPLVTVTANVARTLIELVAPSTNAIKIVQMEVESSATAAGSVAVEFTTFTTTGTGTAFTPSFWGMAQSGAAPGTYKVNDTVEPAGSALGSNPAWTIPLPGMYSILFPSGRELVVPKSGLRAIRVTSASAVGFRAMVVIEVVA